MPRAGKLMKGCWWGGTKGGRWREGGRDRERQREVWQESSISEPMTSLQTPRTLLSPPASPIFCTSPTHTAIRSPFHVWHSHMASSVTQTNTKDPRTPGRREGPARPGFAFLSNITSFNKPLIGTCSFQRCVASSLFLCNPCGRPVSAATTPLCRWSTGAEAACWSMCVAGMHSRCAVSKALSTAHCPGWDITSEHTGQREALKGTSVDGPQSSEEGGVAAGGVVGDPGRLSVRGPLSVALKELEDWGTERPWGPRGGGSKEVPETAQEVRWRCQCLKCSLSFGKCAASFWGFTVPLSLRK